MAAKKKTKPAKKKPAAAKKPARKKKPAAAKKAAPKKAAPKKAAPKKAAPKAKAKTKAKAKAKTKAKAKAKAAPKKATAKASPRRDRAGHIAPKYGRELLAKSGGPDRDATDRGFLRRARSRDDLAEQLGEEVIQEATSGENEGEDILDQEVPEERGGPFVVTPAGQEYAYEPDASNPKGSRREPFPRT